VHCAKVSRHVVLPVELLVADGARVGLALEVSGDIVPVEVAWVSVGIVANLATVGVPILDAEAADGDRCRGICGAGQEALRSRLCIQAGQLRLDLLLHLVAHQVGGGARGDARL